MRKIFFTLGVLLVLTALAYKFYPSYFTVIPPKFKGIENVKVSDVTGEKASLYADVELHNPNWFSVNLSQVKMDLKYEGKTIGVIDKDYELKIPSEDNFKVPLHISVSMATIQEHLLSSILNLFGSSKKPEVHFVGTVTVSTFGLPLSIPIDRKQELDIKL